jgi:hypothetical protein
MSAPRARHSDTGTGLTRPPSTSRRSSCTTGVSRPGSATEARTASMTGPRCSQISRPLVSSVATQAKVFGRCSMPWSLNFERKKSTSRAPRISPPAAMRKSISPITDCQVSPRTQVSSGSSLPAA